MGQGGAMVAVTTTVVVVVVVVVTVVVVVAVMESVLVGPTEVVIFGVVVLHQGQKGKVRYREGVWKLLNSRCISLRGAQCRCCGDTGCGRWRRHRRRR